MPKIQKYQKVAASAALIALLGAGAAGLYANEVAKHEGLVLEAYRDPVGILTKCYGDTYDVTTGATYSREECTQSLNKQLINHAKPVLVCAPELKELSDGEKAAFLDLAYNIGTGNFCASSIPRLLKAGDRAGACAVISRFNRGGGVVMQGLVNRRFDNRELCERGLKGDL
ncbi:MAG: lysozyme [Desulfovibrio sp.]|jgi:lysozyme|nr:lysozyme [Desulfovibrio sp.]